MNPKQENLLRKIFLGSLVDKSIHLSKINTLSPSVLSQLEFKTDGSLTGWLTLPTVAIAASLLLSTLATDSGGQA